MFRLVDTQCRLHTQKPFPLDERGEHGITLHVRHAHPPLGVRAWHPSLGLSLKGLGLRSPRVREINRSYFFNPETSKYFFVHSNASTATAAILAETRLLSSAMTAVMTPVSSVSTTILTMPSPPGKNCLRSPPVSRS